MIRAVAEAVSQACAPVGDYVGDFYPCKHHAQACPCCRLFGGIFPGEESGGYQSKVYFSNTKPIGLVQATPINVDTFHQNLPDLELKRGRRFFAHRAFTQGSQFPVYAVPPEKRFQFEIEFAGLDDDELGLLLYSLVLEPDMAHKLGFMKSRGLGSVKLTIVKVDCTNNYRSFYDGFDATISGMPLENKQQIDNLVNPKIQAYLQKNGLTNSAQVNTLRTILQYAP
jgi:CRISPR/Cas system CSM-associated protein Csm3 (group 7 of RAMP superfamily)